MMETIQPGIAEAFRQEAGELLDHVRNLLAQAGRNPDDEGLWYKLNRALEVVAANARLAGSDGAAGLADAKLLVIQGLIERRYRLSPLHLKLLGLLHEYLVACVAHPEEEAPPLAAALDAARRIYDGESISLKGLSLAEQLRHRHRAETKTETAIGGEETVSISVTAMERLETRLNSVIVQQFQLKKNGDIIQGLEAALRQLNARIGEGAPGDELLQEAETIRKEVQRLDRGLKEDLAAVDRTSFLLQEEIARLRMLPFRVLAERLERQVAEIAARRGCQVRLSVDGESTMLDKMVLELIMAPLSDLAENAVVHGHVDGRAGHVHVTCSSDGNSISLGVADDGPGIDWERIRESAAGLFPQDREEIFQMPEAQLCRFLFETGIAAGGQGGEGVGLPRVREQIEAMQGRVTVDSHPGRGTAFVLQIPASASLVSGFFVRAGGELFFVSSVYVREIVIFDRNELAKLPGGPCYPLRGQMVPVVPLASIFEGKTAADKPVEQMAIVEIMGETWGLMMDSIIRHATLGYRPMPENLAGMKEVQGVVYDEKFHLVPILNIPAVLAHVRRLRSIEFRRRYRPGDNAFRNILLVDDSQVTRDTLARLIGEQGYQVETAPDGIAALDVLRRKYFHLVVCDDAMPRMDGPNLVENLRKETGYANVPIVMMGTGLSAPQEQRLRALGVGCFYRKATFDRQALLKDLARLLDGGAT